MSSERLIGTARLHAQQIEGARGESPSAVVRALGAVQAQDYLGALWAVALRTRGCTEADVEVALAERSIVRSWPMRGTLHFVAAEDLRWMLALCAPHVVRRAARRLSQLGIDAPTLVKARRVLERALADGEPRTRSAVYRMLDEGGVATTGQRGIHILWHLAQEAALCFGPRAGKQHTFALLDRWLPRRVERSREASLAELARRYFTSHGPATQRDFAWWSGLPAGVAREAVALAAAHECVARESMGGAELFGGAASASPPVAAAAAHLLPAFDEYLVGYTDRSAVLDAPRLVNAGGGLLSATVVIDGRVVGSWKRTLTRREVVVRVNPFAPLGRAHQRALERAAIRYGGFLGRAPRVEIA